MRIETKGKVLDLTDLEVIAINMDLKAITFGNSEDADRFQRKLRKSERISNTIYTDTELFNQIYK